MAPATTINIFLCGDVMIGRGIDQVLPSPCRPQIHESYVKSATDYVRLAESVNGPIPKPVDFSYIWGSALDEWRRMQPDVRIINLETAITRSESYERKGINYRMSPENIGCLLAAGINCCALANNHVLDWGRAGLVDTLAVLEHHHVQTAGAGRDLARARAPAALEVADKGRVVVFSLVSPTSGVPVDWAATRESPGVDLLLDLSEAAVDAIGKRVRRIRKPGDIVIASIHWGPNWGYEVAEPQRRFAHALLDRAGVSIVHGHSSHHVKAIEVYRNRLILYGCGDFLNDYEGIADCEKFRDDLSIMYFASFDAGTAELLALDMVPLRIKRFRLQRASAAEVEWLQTTLDRESARFGTRVERTADDRLRLSWTNGEHTEALPEDGR